MIHQMTDHLSFAVWLKTWIANKKNIALEQIDDKIEFQAYGLDSVASVELAADLEELFKQPIETTLLFNYPTINKLSNYLEQLSMNQNESSSVFQKKVHFDVLTKIAERSFQKHDIAIIGIGCRFPHADSPEAFWQLLLNAHDAIDTAPLGHSHHGSQFKGGFLEGSDQFAHAFFNISPREAKCMDPQQRLLLEVSYHTLENAGITMDALEGSNTGVFIGISSKEYEQLQSHDSDIYAATGSALSIAANRLSYFYDLKGPSLAIDTACSSSLMAVHLACRSLQSAETDLAIAGGVNLLLSLNNTEKFAAMGFLSPDHRCKAFDVSANGYVRSEGVGMVILKRLEDAIRDGNRIYAVIKATASNQDGHTNGITAPNQSSQESLLQRVYSEAGIHYSDVDYVECHGTGTALGDPIEIGALHAVLGKDRTRSCRLGSVKTNIGHLEAASGIAGLIKTALMIYHKKYVPNLHFHQPNPAIHFNSIPFKVQQNIEDFTSENKICGINSFGFGGTNVHVILSHMSNHHTGVCSTSSFKSILPENNLLLISAKSEVELEQQQLAYQDYFNSSGDNRRLSSRNDFYSICRTAALNRTHYAYRAVLIAQNPEEALAELNPVSKSERCLEQPKITFVFTGQGTQYSEMARPLLKHTIFQKWIRICDSMIGEHAEFSILEILQSENNQHYLEKSRFIQPVLTAFQIAFSEYLRYLGITPFVVLGHSLGEIAAAYIAGALSLEQAMLLALNRGEVMDPATGAMLAVRMNETDVKKLLVQNHSDAEIAAVNSFSETVIAGDEASITHLAVQLDEADADYITLPVKYAFHSRQMDPLMDVLENRIRWIKSSASSVIMVSTTTGQQYDAAQLDAHYWAEQIRKPVQFLKAIESALQLGTDIFVEIGPRSVLARYIQEIIETTGKDAKVLSANKKQQEEDRAFCKTLGMLYQYGCDIHWNKLYLHGEMADIPNYSWKKYSCWCNSHREVKKMTQIATPILRQLTHIIAHLIQAQPENIDVNKPFIELGADSIIIVNAIKKIQAEFGIKIAVRRLFEDLQTVNKLAEFLENSISSGRETTELKPYASLNHEQQTAVFPEVTRCRKIEPAQCVIEDIICIQNEPQNGRNLKDEGHLSSLTSLFNQQLAVIHQQLELLQWTDTALDAANKSRYVEHSSVRDVEYSSVQETCRGNKQLQQINNSGSWQNRKIDLTLVQNNPDQQHHIETLIKTYTQKTARSKQLTAQYRSVLADSKASVGFRLSIKEMLYPIIGQSTQGSQLVDVDGNTYVDITMGFGVHLFGYRPEFLTNALLNEAHSGLQLGPRSPIVGETAALIAELTGHERVAFSNTGTESIITAIRIARAATGKSKIVLFKGAYHGHSDYTLVEANVPNEDGLLIPVTPGIPANILDNTLVLEYGDASALETIQKEHHNIAAVLVEPIQSRRPELQPVEFLKALRELTQNLDIAFIMDEMITGFRAHPGGVQALFGIKADMATYGKIIGGGLPLGVIAGSKRYMDHIDGGMWQYNDNSYPQVERTFFGGTFCQHPTSLATALAVLKHLKQQGPDLQDQLNKKTAYLAEQLNQFFINENIPIEVVYFSSLFRFKFSGNMDVLFYHLILQGIYVWEWRNCFLSTAHTDTDIETIIQAVKQSIHDMKKSGCLKQV